MGIEQIMSLLKKQLVLTAPITYKNKLKYQTFTFYVNFMKPENSSLTFGLSNPGILVSKALLCMAVHFFV